MATYDHGAIVISPDINKPHLKANYYYYPTGPQGIQGSSGIMVIPTGSIYSGSQATAIPVFGTTGVAYQFDHEQVRIYTSNQIGTRWKPAPLVPTAPYAVYKSAQFGPTTSPIIGVTGPIGPIGYI